MICDELKNKNLQIIRQELYLAVVLQLVVCCLYRFIQHVTVKVTMFAVYLVPSVDLDMDPVSCLQHQDTVYCHGVVVGGSIKRTLSYSSVIKLQIKISSSNILLERSGEEVETSDRSCKDARHRVEPGSQAGDVIWEDERTGWIRLSVWSGVRLLSCEPHLTNRGT